MTLLKKTHLIDTNVILRYLIGDDPQKASQATSLMERVENGTETVEIPTLIIAESVWTLEKFYKVPRKDIADKLLTILTFKGTKGQEKKTILKALALYRSHNVDFADCFLAAKSRELSVSVYSFDKKDFKRLEVERKTP